GTPIHSMSPLSKLVWMRHKAPDIFQKAAKFISIKEYVFYRLFGKFVVDYSVASATGLFNLENLYWDSEALELAGITIEQLSKPVSPTTVFTGVNQEYSHDMGVSAQTPLVIGA